MKAPAPATPVAEWLGRIWDAWWTLHPDRPMAAGGMGPPVPGRIPFRDMVLWCDRHGFDDLDLLRRCFTAMDQVYLDHWAIEAAAAARRAAGKGAR